MTRTRSSASSKSSDPEARSKTVLRRPVTVILLTMVLAALLAGEQPAESASGSPAPDPWELAQQAWQRRGELQDSTCIFLKTERVGGRMLPTRTIELKVRQEPLSIHMRWLEAPHKGREVVYQEGRFDGKMVAYLGDLFGFESIFTFSPTGAEAMQENRHPITEAGIGHITKRLYVQCRQARNRGDLRARHLGTERYLGRPTYKIMRVLEDGGYRYWNIDTELLLPIRVITYDARHQLQETYSFKDLQLNVGLTDDDFDPQVLW